MGKRAYHQYPEACSKAIVDKAAAAVRAGCVTPALLAGYIGVTRPTLVRWIREGQRPDADKHLRDLAIALGMANAQAAAAEYHEDDRNSWNRFTAHAGLADSIANLAPPPPVDAAEENELDNVMAETEASLAAALAPDWTAEGLQPGGNDPLRQDPPGNLSDDPAGQ